LILSCVVDDNFKYYFWHETSLDCLSIPRN
jgi:hypothetical protein